MANNTFSIHRQNRVYHTILIQQFFSSSENGNIYGMQWEKQQNRMIHEELGIVR